MIDIGFDASKLPSSRTSTDAPGPPAQIILRELLSSSVILHEDWEKLSAETRVELAHCDDTRLILSSLKKHSLLTDYQADRVAAGEFFGLILGNYRVLDRIGAGGMGVVFK